MNGSFRFKEHEIGVFNTKFADDACLNFSKNCHLMGMTMGEFSLIDLIHSVLKKSGPADVLIATWSAGIKDAHQVKWMIDTDLIKSIRFLTDHSFVNRQKRYAASITDLFGAENIRTSEMHAKFVTIKNKDYDITIVSSMNLNANRTCETFAIYENKNITDFYNEFASHHFENMNCGFEKSSAIVNRCITQYFKERDGEKNIKPSESKSKHWSEL